MAAQHRVQRYLERHKIGNVFEDLMGRVVRDMPDQPITYLMRVLERRAEKLGLVKKPEPEAPPPAAKRSASPSRRSAAERREKGQLAATWEDPKGRQYRKPWQAGAKNPPSPPHQRRENMRPAKKGLSGSGSNLDELWASGDGLKTAPARGHRSQEVKARAAWKDEEASAGYQVRGKTTYAGPLKPRGDLADELKVASTSGDSSVAETSTRPAISNKKKDFRSAAERHRRELEQALLATDKSHDSGYDDHQASKMKPDSAVVMIENDDALAREGVISGVSSSSKFSKRRAIARGPRGQVKDEFKVTICARCAKVMTGVVAGAVDIPEPSGDFSSYEDRLFESTSRPNTADASRYTGRRHEEEEEEEEEEFESVSQVTGPRRPTWQESDGPKVQRPYPISARADDDVRRGSPYDAGRKGMTVARGEVERDRERSMMAASLHPRTGQPMYSASTNFESQPVSFDSQQSSNPMTQSMPLGSMPVSTLSGSGKPMMASYDISRDPLTDRQTVSDQRMSDKRNVWGLPPGDSEDEMMNRRQPRAGARAGVWQTADDSDGSGHPDWERMRGRRSPPPKLPTGPTDKRVY